MKSQDKFGAYLNSGSKGHAKSKVNKFHIQFQPVSPNSSRVNDDKNVRKYLIERNEIPFSGKSLHTLRPGNEEEVLASS
jgi:hypothetical protein